MGTRKYTLFLLPKGTPPRPQPAQLVGGPLRAFQCEGRSPGTPIEEDRRSYSSPEKRGVGERNSFPRGGPGAQPLVFFPLFLQRNRAPPGRAKFLPVPTAMVKPKNQRSRLPVILVINKIDTVPKTAVLDAMETYRKEMDFAEIVPVSALRSNNTDTLLDCIFKYLPYGEPFYDEDTITDQPQRQIVAEMIREKALRCLEEEIPHGIAVAVERMEFKEHIVNIDATIICERDSHKGIIIGKQGSMLKKIGSQARRDIEDMLECQVNLQLWVKVKKDWRDSDFLLKNFGYNPADTRPDR